MLSNSQYGFRRSRNTELAATVLLDDIRDGMDKGKFTGVVFIDLSKAFDTISHASMIDKLPLFGIKNIEKEWLTDYLFNRSQLVNFENTYSHEKSVYTGVPQGSILGPLLFILHFNGIASKVKHCRIIKYADDTVIYVSEKELRTVKSKLEEDLTTISEWMIENKLIINLEKFKTEAMLFGTSQKLSRNKEDFEIKFCDQNLFITSSYKYLGIKLDQSLTFNEHFHELYNKAIGRLKLLHRLRVNLTIKSAKTIYQSMIQSLYLYCTISTPIPNNTYLRKLDLFEIRAMRIIYLNNIPIEPIKPIAQLIKKHLCKLTFQAVKGELCPHFNNYFNFTKSTNTRNSGFLLALPRARTEVYKKSFKFMGSKLYNDLPLHVRKANSTEQFISLYDLDSAGLQ